MWIRPSSRLYEASSIQPLEHWSFLFSGWAVPHNKSDACSCELLGPFCTRGYWRSHESKHHPMKMYASPKQGLLEKAK